VFKLALKFGILPEDLDFAVGSLKNENHHSNIIQSSLSRIVEFLSQIFIKHENLAFFA
jgi:hypothetical protein